MQTPPRLRDLTTQAYEGSHVVRSPRRLDPKRPMFERLRRAITKIFGGAA